MSRPEGTGYNGTIAYAMLEDIEKYAYVSPYDLSEKPALAVDLDAGEFTGVEGERTIYITRSAAWSTTDTDEAYESNYRSLKRDFPDTFLEVSYSYSHVLALDITDRETDEDVAYLLDVLVKMDDEYPLYDEEDYSELQWDNQVEYLESGAAWDFRRECGDEVGDIEDAAIVAALKDAVWNHDCYGDWDGTGYCAWDDIVAATKVALGIEVSA